MDEYISRLQKLSEYMNYFIDATAFTYQWHLRIITDTPVAFPKNYELVKYDTNIEVNNISWDKHERSGWSKPDKQFLDVEVRYLWKQFKPMSFYSWLLKN